MIISDLGKLGSSVNIVVAAAIPQSDTVGASAGLEMPPNDCYWPW